MPPRTNPELCSNLPRNSLGKIRGSPVVHRNHNQNAHRASKKRRHPLRAVFAPQHHPVALADFARGQLQSKARRNLGNLGIRPALRAVPAPLHVGAGRAHGPEILQIVGDCRTFSHAERRIAILTWLCRNPVRKSVPAGPQILADRARPPRCAKSRHTTAAEIRSFPATAPPPGPSARISRLPSAPEARLPSQLKPCQQWILS